LRFIVIGAAIARPIAAIAPRIVAVSVASSSILAHRRLIVFTPLLCFCSPVGFSFYQNRTVIESIICVSILFVLTFLCSSVYIPLDGVLGMPQGKEEVHF